MAKKKKAPQITQDEMRNLFEKAKKKVQQIGKETGIWIKKGEAELLRLSKMGRLEIDIVNLNLKKEKLLKDIGKRVIESGMDKEIGDSAIRDMGLKIHAIGAASSKKKGEITRMKKSLLKGKAARTKKAK